MSKIDDLREALGYPNKNKFAEFLGVENSVVYTYDRRDSYGKKFVSFLKERIPNLNEAYFLLDDPEMFITDKPEPKPKDVTPVSVYGKIKAGIPAQMWENEKYPIYIGHPDIKPRGELYGFEVDGDSMYPRFTNGDVVISERIKPPDKPRTKDIVVTALNSDPGTSTAKLKIFSWVNQDEGTFILSSINPKELPAYHHIKDVRNIFRVLANLSIIHYKK